MVSAVIGDSATRRKIVAGAAGLVVLIALLSSGKGGPAVATHKPANVVTAAGSTVEVVGPGEEVTLLTGTLRTASPTDLILSVTAECALTTNVTTVGNDDSSAFGQVRVWVEIDGNPVGVTSGDDGKVVFCNRAYQRKTSQFDDEDATIETFFSTRAANGFNWLALNVGNGIHVITVKGELTETAVNKASAKAAVGKRTLFIKPEMLANDATI